MLYKETRSRPAHGPLVTTWLRADRPTWWTPAVALGVLLFVLVTCLALTDSFLTSWDSTIAQMHLVPADSHWHGPVSAFVFLGLWIAVIIIAGSYATFRACRERSIAPLIMFVIAGALFAISIASVKYALGRVGPRETTDAVTIWGGGTIYPSGHAAAAVVMYGTMALIAPAVHRKMLAVLTVVISLGVGIGTMALGTHWMSDVIGAWLDGALVLLITWAVTPEAHRRWLSFAHRWRQAHTAAHPAPRPAGDIMASSPLPHSTARRGAEGGGLELRGDPGRISDGGTDHHRIRAGVKRRRRLRREVVTSLGGDDGGRQRRAECSDQRHVRPERR